ncbi:uncharacterized protein LOC108050734 [Drosophila rhopaloa]|uniref:Uncharacterized protein n=1 Tax=Drosophila rhopaloa TaxID=1041015 RepID=A0ABM5J2A7_DRORH|nr:uncharacterized protein LOC108050734 [Drosophila rhopaloa]
MPVHPVDGGNYESEYIHSLINQMIAGYPIETLVTYGVNRELQRFRNIVANSVEQTLTEEFKVPIVVWGLRRNVNLRNLLGYKTMICVSITSVIPAEEPIFDALTDGLAGLHYVPMLFIYSRLESIKPTKVQLNIFFAWCWRHRFTNVFITFQHIVDTKSYKPSWYNELHSYTPFPELTLRNLTQTGYQYVNILMDLRGYEFRVPVFQDALSVFQLKNGRLSGSLGHLLATYVHQRKGRLRLEPVADVDWFNYPEHLMLAAARGEIEMGVHPYSPMQPGSSLTSGSFTVGITKTCVLVPWQRVSPAARFMLMTACVNGPFFLVLLLAMTVSWRLLGGQGRRGIHLALVTIFQQSLPSREFLRLAQSYKYIHVAILFGCFILWSKRTANLSSVFTSQMLGSQIETAKDFLATPLRLMLTETEVEMYFTAGLLPSALRPRLLVVNKTTLMEHLGSLNTSYAYCTTSEYWNLIVLKQWRMYRPLFRRASKMCTTPQILRFPIQKNSPFDFNFYRFRSDALQFGFLTHWLRQSIREATELGLVVNLTDEYQPFQSLTLMDIEKLIKLYIICLPPGQYLSENTDQQYDNQQRNRPRPHRLTSALRNTYSHFHFHVHIHIPIHIHSLSNPKNRTCNVGNMRQGKGKGKGKDKAKGPKASAPEKNRDLNLKV